MKLPLGNLQAVVLEYLESVVLPAATVAGGAAPFLVGMAGGLIARRVPAMAEQYAPALRALGVLDEENRLDIDLLHQEACASLEKHPIVVAGYKPDRGDLDKMKAIMERHGG